MTVLNIEVQQTNTYFKQSLEEEQRRMKKKLLSVLLSTAMIATLLVGCADDKAATTEPTDAPEATEGTETEPTEATEAEALPADTGKVLNIYCWNDEFQTRVKEFYPDYTDNGDGTGKIGEIAVNWVITPSQDNAYQNKLDESLLAQADAAADEKIDLFLFEADYALKYVNSDYTLDIKKDLGITDADLANQYQYTKDVVTDANGAQKGTTWQGCPGLYIYRRSIAKDVFGTEEPADIQAKLSDWSKFNAAAAEVGAKGYKMVSGYDDSYRVFQNNAKSPWVVDGKVVIDENLMAWVDQTKEFTDKGYNNKTSLWDENWAKGQSSKGDVFGYFFPAWGIDFVMVGNSKDDKEGPDEVGNGAFGDWAAVEGPQGYNWGGTWVAGAVGSDNLNLVKDIMVKITATEDIMKDIATKKGDFVNNQPAMEAMAAVGAPDSLSSKYLGGQNVIEKFAAAAPTISMANITGYDQGCNEEFQKAMKDYFDGNVTKEVAIENFKKAIVVKYPDLSVE